jgi:hypothetical protein
MWWKSGFYIIKKNIKLGDVILIVCLIGIGGITGKRIKKKLTEGKWGIILKEGKEIYKLNIKKDTIITVKGKIGEMKVEIKNRKVKVLTSSCPLKLCVKQKEIEKGGEEIICLPNQIMIKIKGEKKVDSITW